MSEYNPVAYLRSIFLCVALALSLPSSLIAQEADPVGTWEGTLVIPQGSLPILFHIKAGDDGFVGTMDSPSQNATGIPLSSVALNMDSLTIGVAMIQGEYSGVISGDSISGTWSQGPASLPLDLVRKKTSESNELGYNSEDLFFDNPAEGVKLAGTLTTPKGDGPFPAVVLVSGSGPQDRDESIMGHKPFRVIADYLTNRGIAVLRYDDRGYGLSTGVFADATIESFASDARAAVDFLQTRSEIAHDNIGIIGHSEGGIVAPMIAAASDDIAFIVLLAGPAIPGSEILKLQTRLIAEVSGSSEEEIATNTAVQNKVFDVLTSDVADSVATSKVREILTDQFAAMSAEERQALGLTEESIDIQVQTLLSPWFRHFVSYDPGPTLTRVSCPVLALFAEKDLQVPATENILAMEKLVDVSGQNEIIELAGLNHLFQTAVTGSPQEYATIEETIAPQVLDKISSWIDLVVAPSGRVGS